MAATLPSPRLALLNRRRCVRQKVHAPAYATFPAASQGQMLELYEVLDISEMGVAVQCSSPMEADREVNLCLDFAETNAQILTTAKVIWSNSAGRVGLGFSRLGDSDRLSLQQWLFLNAMASAANAASFVSERFPNYTDTLNAVSAVQREAESLGSDLAAVLSLIAGRSKSLLRASGAAVALAGEDEQSMVCRASAGEVAPPIGAKLRSGSGFSGDCVRSGMTVRCDDSDTDSRVDAQTCRDLGIRSMLATPIRADERIVGLIEVFSSEPNGFGEKDATVLQRLAETIATAVKRAMPSIEDPAESLKSFSAGPGSILFTEPVEQSSERNPVENPSADHDKLSGISLPRTHLYLLIAAAATVALALGFILAPWIQEKFHARTQNSQSTVLAASQPPALPQPDPPVPSAENANFEQLLRLARQGNPSAENALGILFAQGDDKQSIKQDEAEAANWFAKAAEHGNVPSQYKLALLYWGGHGVPKDPNKAYFWAVLARAAGQPGSQDLAKVLANGMTRAQATAIEQQAEVWYQQHQSQLKPAAGH